MTRAPATSAPEQTCPERSGRQDKSCYFLAPLVYVACTRQGVVFLDLRRNRYSGLDAASAQAVTRIVKGFPPCHEPRDRPESELAASDDAPDNADALVSKGLLSRCAPSNQHIFSLVADTQGDLISIGDELDCTTTIRAHHAAAFLIACAAAKLALTCVPLHVTVARVRARRLAARSAPEFDPMRAAELTSVFRRLRPYFFTPKGNCLFHALALTNFLSRYGLFPMWVFGVKTDPWGAHSWVQEGDFILDTNPEKVCEFTPILAV